jgi:hypothetical protein
MTDTHDKLIAAFQEYFKWQDRFHHRQSDAAGIKARIALSEIKECALERRKEIQELRKQRNELRQGKNGRPLKGTYD